MEQQATVVLEQQIKKVTEKISQCKIEIADLFIKIHKSKPLMQCDFSDFMDKINEMDKMPPLLLTLGKYENQLEVLLQSKREIESSIY